MLTYLIGPILALFPRRWRRALPSSLQVNWRPATALSGFAEAVLAIVAFMHWYWYVMSTWVDREWDAALAGKLPVGTTDHQIGFTALLILATHPLTWIIAYFGLEGSVRLLNAIASETNMGILPLFVVDKVFGKITGRVDPKPGVTFESSKGNVASYFEAVGDSVMTNFLPNVPDELSFVQNQSEEILEIRACRKKADWIPPRVVRYGDAYYRLEADSRGMAPRPFHYRLRRLERGVPGRNVLIYSPDRPLVHART
jgi:hypothetical protein